MKPASVIIFASFSLFPQIAEAQITDCNQLARDLVVRNFQSSWSDYSKLFFLSSLTKMDLQTSKDALEHSGKVSVGPISIGPGTWSKDKQDQLRSDLQKIVNIDQLIQSAASVSVSSGDPQTAKVVTDCFKSGGLFVALKPLGNENAVVELQWTSFPTAKITAVIDNVTVVHGKIIGGSTWAKKGAKLNDRLTQRITIERSDPKRDLSVVINTSNAGSDVGYLPPSVLPPPPPPPVLRVAIDGEQKEAGLGGATMVIEILAVRNIQRGAASGLSTAARFCPAAVDQK